MTTELILLAWLVQVLPSVSDPLPSVEDMRPACTLEQAAEAAALAEVGTVDTPSVLASTLPDPDEDEDEGESLSLDDQVAGLLRERCADCHGPGDPLPLTGDLAVLMTGKGATGIPYVQPGQPGQSYLFWKVTPTGSALIKGDTMPPGGHLSDRHLVLLRKWLEQSAASTASYRPKPRMLPKQLEFSSPDFPAFPGGYGPTGPTTAMLGGQVLAVDVRQRLGALLERNGYLGLKSGGVLSLGLTYGVTDWLDVLARFSTLGGDIELGVKIMPFRQARGDPLSFGSFMSYEGISDIDVQRRSTWNLMALASRLWGKRWATGVLFGYSAWTTHELAKKVLPGDVDIPDRRGSMYFGLQSAIFLDRWQQHSLDMEWLYPITADALHFHGDSTSAELLPTGSLSLGWSGRFDQSVFQVFLSNTKAIHSNWWAPGPEIRRFNESLLIGFNISRLWRFK